MSGLARMEDDRAMRRLGLGRRVLRALGTASAVLAIALGSLVGLHEWADATATHVSSAPHHSTGPRT